MTEDIEMKDSERIKILEEEKERLLLAIDRVIAVIQVHGGKLKGKGLGGLEAAVMIAHDPVFADKYLKEMLGKDEKVKKAMGSTYTEESNKMH